MKRAIRVAIPFIVAALVASACGGAGTSGGVKSTSWIVALIAAKTACDTGSSGASEWAPIAATAATQRSGVAYSPRTSASPSACLAASACAIVRKASSMAVCPRACSQT